MKNIFYTLLIIGFSFIGCQQATSNKLEIAAAANMQFPMEEITAAFEQAYGIPTNVSISSSGNLTNQIKNGAPYQIFLSADMSYPEDLFKNGFAPNAPQAYAYGKLVLWTTLDEKPSVEWLQNDKIKHIAVGNPRLAPYGVAAQEVLEHYNVYDKLQPKLVFGESITQVNQFINSGAAEVGFTALAVVKSPNNKTKGQYIQIPEDLYSPIGQGVVLIQKDGEIDENAQLFYDFLMGEKVREILMKFGYGLE